MDELDTAGGGPVGSARQGFGRVVVVFGLASFGYLLCARLGHAVSTLPSGVVTFWPPSGVMLAGLLLARRRDWPAILSGVFAGSLGSDLAAGHTLEFSTWAGLANSGGFGLAALLVSRLARRPVTLASLRQVAGFAVGAVILSNSLSALALAVLLHHTYGTAFGWA